MKVITPNAAYLQKYYFEILLKSTLVTKVGIPISICDIVNKNKFDKYENKDFIKFTKDEEIKFLKEADWIPNFNDYVEKSIDDIELEIELINSKGNELNNSLPSLTVISLVGKIVWCPTPCGEFGTTSIPSATISNPSGICVPAGKM